MDNKKVTGVIVDYTNKVKSKIEELYKNATEANKAIFLLYLINRGTSNTQGYQLNKENHRHLFGVNGVQWSSIIQPLIENNVIMCTSTHQDGVKSQTFAINNVYKWSVNDGEIKDRYTVYSSMPRYIQKYLVDGYVVANAKQTKWSKDYQFIQEDKINMEANEKINQLEFKVSILEELVQSMQEQINQLVNNNNNNILQPSTDNEEVIDYNQYFEPKYVNDSEGNLVSSSEDVYASTLIERKNIKGADTPFFKDEDLEAENKIDLNVDAFIVSDSKNEIVFDNDVQQVEIKEVKQVEEVTVSEKELIATRICSRHIRDVRTKKEIVKYVLNTECIDVQQIINKGISGATATRLYNELLQVI